MRLATIQTAHGSRAVVRRGDAYVDWQATNGSLPATVQGLLAAGPEAMQAVAALADSPHAICHAVDGAQLLPPIPHPPKIICIGLNYRDHAAESGRAIPAEPVLFSKFATALVGSGDPIVLPPVSNKVDYEAELVAVIGKSGRHIPVKSALEYVAGYTVGHDVSARDWQFKGEERQWTIGKTFDTFAPVGPELVTADELGDPHTLGIRLRLNGQTMQDSNTSQLIFGIPELVAYLSQVFTLEPGDLIFTGTPPGVGAARKPAVYLKPGDEVEIEIDRIGRLHNSVIQG